MHRNAGIAVDDCVTLATCVRPSWTATRTRCTEFKSSIIVTQALKAVVVAKFVSNLGSSESHMLRVVITAGDSWENVGGEADEYFVAYGWDGNEASVRT
jgi:hypothetical protein